MSTQNQTMEIDMDLYNKLLKCAIFRASPKSHIIYEKKRVQLDTDTIALFENGIALSRYIAVLKEIFKKGNQDLNIDADKLQQVKNQSTPQSKLFNWNIICGELDKLGIVIDADIRSLIVAGDAEQILNIFMRTERFLTKISGKQINFDLLRPDQQAQVSDNVSEKTGNARRGNKPNQKKKIIKDGVDILTMNAEREIIDTESTLELILNTLCKAFVMKPKQSAALLTNNNQFLIHSIVKGVKGKYEPLIAWYQDLYQNSRHLTNLLELEMEQLPHTNNFVKVLATLSCGLYSNNIEICKWCSKLLTKIGYDFGTNQQMFDQAMSWFLEKEGGLELSLHAFKKHQDLAEDFVQFVQQFSTVNDQMEQVYRVELKKYFSSPLEYVNAINDLFPFLCAQANSEMRRSGVIEFWLESSIRQSDNDGKHSYDERIAALTLLTEIWIQFTDIVDRKEELANSIQQMLKRGARDKYKPIRIVAICELFRLLDKFSEEKNASAPAVYKTLIFSLVESPGDSSVRYLFFCNFTSLFEQNSTIPIGLLVDPLIKQIQVTEGVTYFFKIFDFDFFTFLAKHPKLPIQYAIPLVDLLAKVYLNDVSNSSAAKVPFILIASRFINEEAMQEFLIKFETICLSMLMGLEKNAEELQQKHQLLMQAKEAALAKTGPKKLLALPAPPQQQKKVYTRKMTKEQKQQKIKEQEDELHRRLKKSNIVELSMKIQNLRNEEINEQLRGMLLSTNKRFNELYGYFNKGIQALLKWWGDPDQVMGAYIRAIEEREQKEREERERLEREERERLQREQEEQERLDQEERERRQQEMLEKMKKEKEMNDEERRLMIGYDSEGNQSMSKSGILRNSMSVVPYSGKGQVKNFKAIQQIEKIKRNKMQREEQKRLEEERKKTQFERLNKKLKDELTKRKIEQGVMPDNYGMKALIYETTDDSDKKQVDRRLILPQIRLLDLNEEEGRDKEAVEEYLKKYAKLWKNLFYKYANCGYSSKQINNFEQLEEKFNTLNLPEAIKMLKDHNAFPNLLNQEEVKQIFRLINTKIFNGSDLQALEYAGFSQFMLQLAFFCFSRPPRDLSHLPPVETLRALVNHFEKACRSRGLSTVLYEDPDITGVGDKQLIKALNDKLQQDPSYPIPEGYFKQVERNPSYSYQIPETVASFMSEAQVVSIETLDNFIFELMDFHFLEPLVSYEERLKVRPIVRNLYKPQAEALNYMKKVEKKIKPLDQQLNDKASMTADEKRKQAQEVKPVLNVALKLEVAQYSLKERPYVQEIAEVLEEILQATEKGLDQLPNRLNRAPGQLMNEVKQQKQDQYQSEVNLRKEKEDKRVKRNNHVKEEIKKTLDEKHQQMQETKQQREELMKKERDLKVKRMDQAKQRIEEARRSNEQTKQLNMEEIRKKREEEEEKRRQIEEQKKKERAEFLKNQKVKIQNEFTTVKNERELLAEQKEALEVKEKEMELRIRNNMEEYIKDHQGDRLKEIEERQQVNELLQQHDVESIFGLYNNSLTHFYKFYASQEMKEVNFSLEKSMNTMNFREFIRFGFQQNIVPALLPPETMVFIYRQLIRERVDEVASQVQDKYLVDNDSAQVLDYHYFKKAIVRIAVMAQDRLGGQKEDLFLQLLEEETQKKEEEQKKKDLFKRKELDSKKQEQQMKEQMKQEFLAQQKEMTAKMSKSPAKNISEAEDENGGNNNKTTKKLNKSEQLEISIAKKQNEDAFFAKWMKQRESQGISLKKRIIGKEKDAGKKTIKKKRVTLQESEEIQEEQKTQLKKKGTQQSQGASKNNTQSNDYDNMREGEDIEDDNYNKTLLTSSPSGIQRKTKETKALKDMHEKTLQKDQLSQLTIEDKQVRQELKINVVSAKTIEALLRFLGIEPDDTRQGLDTKLNMNRIEIQGQKPTKIKKQLGPNKIDNIKETVPRVSKIGSQDQLMQNDEEGEEAVKEDEGLE